MRCKIDCGKVQREDDSAVETASCQTKIIRQLKPLLVKQSRRNARRKNKDRSSQKLTQPPQLK
ncbi:MAG: hypothetical protein EAZ39_25920 [Oscillatoriales cyanobacterium]|nr:MAG: hypothetical protein EAZ45_11915 [Oscillatoriales cyanobacterium]TAG14041.1 MAG: hypothetical protein EAZ39_25920 [Oscillatoriales cyanobacterium]TAG43785.1 MAG: hypothetical protein EAZ33_11910 [Oscillatoriales cyanobacterium]TAG54142.1 MAG: hypothetical protein EAZ28_25775 [Oscillatoriales cyanobacterium]